MAVTAAKINTGRRKEAVARVRLVPGEGNAMASYRDDKAFLRMLKSGKNPDGRALAVMPFEALSKLSETDARALHLYLTQLGD